MASAKPQFQFNPLYNSGVAPIFFKVNFGTGAATLSTDAGEAAGVTSFARDSAGTYTLILNGPIQSVLGVGVTITNAAGVPTVPFVGIKTAFVPSTGTVVLVLSDADTPAATDPVNGDVGDFIIWTKNTTTI